MHFLRGLYTSSSISSSLTLKLFPTFTNVLSRSITTTSFICNAQNYYEILGVKSNCSQKEIRSAYLELCKKYHPDKVESTEKENDNAKNARFQRIAEAYDCLSKESDRTRYDLDLQTGNTGRANYYRHTADPQTFYRQRGYPRGYYRQYNQYYDNFNRMHFGYGYKQPKDRNPGSFNDVELFGTSIAFFFVASLIIVSVLQWYNLKLEAEMLQANTDRKFELMSKLYREYDNFFDDIFKWLKPVCFLSFFLIQMSSNLSLFELGLLLYVVYRDWARRNGVITNNPNSVEQVKFNNLYKDNSIRKNNNDLFCVVDESISQSRIDKEKSTTQLVENSVI